MADIAQDEEAGSRSSLSSTSTSSSIATRSRHRHLRDDVDTFTCGDLGFGYFLKPGGIPTRKFNPDTLEYEDEPPDNSVYNKILSLGDPEESLPPFGKLRSSSSPCLRARDKLYSDTFGVEEQRRTNFPVLDGVPFGTSWRQQRALYEEKMKEYLERKKTFTDCAIMEDGSAEIGASLSVLDAENIQTKLFEANEEVEVLQCELEACKRQLDSKFRAIQILKSQSMLINTAQKKHVETSAVAKKSLEKEVNSLQFELDAKMSSLMISEQTWGERFDRMCLENSALMATLQARSDELRNMHTQKMAIVRERDELLARMNAKERLEYDRESNQSNKDTEESPDTSFLAELAVLGACSCRVSKPEPCRCARAAAKLKKDNQQLMAEVARLSHELAAAHLSADSFRHAFEDQLDHNSTLGWHVAQDMSRKKRSIRQRLPWKRKLNQPDTERKVYRDNSTEFDENGVMIPEIPKGVNEEKDMGPDVRSIGVQASQPEPDLIEKLIELLNDRSQALAHQRLVAKMLARRTQDLEETMSRLTKLTGSHEV